MSRVKISENQLFAFTALALGIITLFLYWPVWGNDFINTDDKVYITENPHVTGGLTLANVRWALTSTDAANWHPLTWMSHMMDCQLFGLEPGAHHMVSVFFHIANSLLLLLLLKDTTGALWRSVIVAALFAWHPMHVESVSWASERKDVLSTLFWLLSLLAYVRYSRNQKVTPYILSLLFFIGGLMSKPMVVTLPCVLLLLDFWPLNRWQMADGRWQNGLRLVWEKVPFLILSVIACALTMHAQEIAIVSTAGLSVSQRVAHSLAAYNHYLAAMFVPINLAVYYPYQIHLPALTVVCAVSVLGLATFFAIKNFRDRPYLIVGWLWYLGTLVPVIGLVQVGDQAWADRYTYIPLIGLFVATVWLAGETVKSRIVLSCVSGVVAGVLIAATSMQLGYWKNTRTLFEHANAVTSKNYMAITMLGSQLAEEHKYDEAIAYYQTALRYQPTFPEAHFFMGAALDEQGKLDAAIAEYEQALWFKPVQEQTHIFLGIALGRQKKYDEAMAHYQAALKINPDSAVAENNLARILHTLGRLDEAVQHYHAALEIDPKLALAHNNLGILLLQRGDLTDGTIQLRTAMQLNPTNTETRFNLAMALNQQQQWPEAVELFSKTVRGDLPDPKAHYQFAVALTHMQKTRAAMSEFASALLLQPDYPEALDGLAWILSTDTDADFRNGAEALDMAGHACDLTGRKDPEKLKTLAAACAENGRYDEAQKNIRLALELAPAASQPELHGQCALMLDCFNKSQPWREK